MYSNRKRILTYLAALIALIVVPVFMVPREPQEMPLIWSCALVLLFNIVSAMVLPLIQFRFLMKKRSCDLYLPLPIDKKHLFFLQYGLGIVILFLPNIIFFLGLAFQPYAWQFFACYVVLMLGFALLTGCYYSILVFLVLKCNTFWDAVFAVFGFTLAQVLFAATMENVLDSAVQEVLIGGGSPYEFFFVPLLQCFVSPIIGSVQWLLALIEAFFQYFQYHRTIRLWEQWFAWDYMSLWMFLYYAVILIAALFASVHVYEKRKGESSEQKTTSKWIYPLAIFLITGCLIFQNIMKAEYFWITIVAFFIMTFLAERKIVIRIKSVLYLFGITLTAILFFEFLVMTNGFQQIHEFYPADEIKQVNISLNLYSEKPIPYKNKQFEEYRDETITSVYTQQPSVNRKLLYEVLELQKLCVDHYNKAQPSTASISIDYVLKDGTKVYRHYPIMESDTDLSLSFAAYLMDEGNNVDVDVDNRSKESGP